VLHLQELDRPLHVSKAAATQLEMGGTVRSPRQPLGVDTGLDPTDFAYVGVGDAAGGKTERVDELGELPAKLPVTHERTRTQQRLCLPDS